MNKNTILLIAAGVAAYLIWKKFNKASSTSGVGQTVDWRRLPMPGMSMGSQQPWKDESIASPTPTQFMRSGRLAEFSSVESIGAAEFGGLGTAVEALTQAQSMLSRFGAGASFQSLMDDPQQALRANPQSSAQSASAPSGGGMSMGRIGPMLPSIATGTYDYGRGRSLTEEESRARSRTAGGFGGTGRPGSGGAPRSGAMLPSIATGTYDYGRDRSLTEEESRARSRTAGGFGGTGRPGSGGAPRSGAMLPRLSTGTYAPPAEAPASPAFTPMGRPDMSKMQWFNPSTRFADQPAGAPHPLSQMSMPGSPAPGIPPSEASAIEQMDPSMIAQGTRQFGSDSWGGDAGTSMERAF